MDLFLGLLFIVNQHPSWLLIRVDICFLFEQFFLEKLLLSKWLNRFIQSVNSLFLSLFALRLLKTEHFILCENLLCVLLNSVLRVRKYILRDCLQKQDPEISEGSVFMDPFFWVSAVTLTTSHCEYDFFKSEREVSLGLVDNYSFWSNFIK